MKLRTPVSTLLAVAALAAADPSAAAPPWEPAQQTQLGCSCAFVELAFGSSGRTLALADAGEVNYPWIAARAADGS